MQQQKFDPATLSEYKLRLISHLVAKKKKNKRKDVRGRKKKERKKIGKWEEKRKWENETEKESVFYFRFLM